MKIACTNCGANVVFVPSSGMCHCHHCGKDIPVEEFPSQMEEISYDECTCSSCGAKLIVDETTAITVCAYCGSREFITQKYREKYHVDGIIPFQVDKEEFIKHLEEFLKSLKHVPMGFQQTASIEDVKGIYLPMEYYASEEEVYARGKWEARIPPGFELGFHLESQYLRSLDSRIEKNQLDIISSYQLKDLTAFLPAYLPGFSAQAVSKEHGKTFVDFTRRGIDYKEKTIHKMLKVNDSFSEFKASFSVLMSHPEKEELKIILVPIWIFTVKYGNKSYPFMMNGQNGVVFGQKPHTIFAPGEAGCFLTCWLMGLLSFLLLVLLGNLDTQGKYENVTIFLMIAFFVFDILGIFSGFFFSEKKSKYDYRNPTQQHISKKVCKKYFPKKYERLFGKENFSQPKANWECSKEEFAEYTNRLRQLRKGRD